MEISLYLCISIEAMNYKFSISDFMYEESSLQHLRRTPIQVEGCIVMLCTCGRGRLITGIESIELVPDTTTMFLGGSSLFLTEASEDFHVRQWSISRTLYEEIIPAIPSSFIDFLAHIPAYLHSAEATSLKYVKVAMDMAQLLMEENGLPTAHIRIKNFATSYILYLFDYISPYLSLAKEKYNAQEYLYRRFVADIYNYCKKEHDLQFYANRLCISKRYLSQIVHEVSCGHTPKQLIDKQLIFQIKSLLASTNLTVTQIADQLHFPDQSYLSRFFKRHTQVYPSEYRREIKR